MCCCCNCVTGGGGGVGGFQHRLLCMLPQRMKWDRSRRLVNAPFVAHGRLHPGHELEASTATTLRCSLRFPLEMLWERHRFWKEWSVPKVLRTRRTFQLFGRPLRTRVNKFNYTVSLGTVTVCSYVQRFVFCKSLFLQNIEDGYTKFFFVFLDTFTGQPVDNEKPGFNIFLLCFRIRKLFGFIRCGDTFKLRRNLNLICNQVNNCINNKKSDLS